jgi:N utilization substance protein B
VSDLGASRHRARERALEILYEATIKARSVGAILSELTLAPDEYTVAVVNSTETHRARAEELIARHAEGWTLDRLALIDRLVMTMAIGEMLMDDPPPTAVVLDEAVELAKNYSTEGSASFVNGVLAACTEDLR